MQQAVVRTITLGLADPHPLTTRRLERAAAQLRVAEAACRDAGFDVQTVRISSRAVFDDLRGPTSELVAYAVRLQSELDALGIDHFSLGPAPAVRDFPLDRLDVIEDLLCELPALSCAVQLATAEDGIRVDAALPVARTMLRIAERTPDGIGNFRFAALACVQPGHPFFPAAYHEGPDALSVGLQGAGIVTAALADLKGPDLRAITDRVRDALVREATPVVDLVRGVADEAGLHFGGIDLSPAPALQDGIGEAVRRGVGGEFGAPGTVAVVGAITAALRSTGLPTCGYNGLMLPVLEDPVLAREWERGSVTAHQLLAYSAICGTGLDTVPLPGDTPAEEIAGLLLDVATLATRLAKPLSARLFPLPGKRSGDRTALSSPHLTNLTLPGRC